MSVAVLCLGLLFVLELVSVDTVLLLVLHVLTKAQMSLLT